MLHDFRKDILVNLSIGNEATTAKKCVFVIGPESSGSKLIARICAHVLGIKQYEPMGGCDFVNETHKVCHRSLPFLNPPQYPDIEDWINQNKAVYNLFFILTTRDITISEQSRARRFKKSTEQVKEESEIAKTIMTSVMENQPNCFIWSYETFMFLRMPYLQKLYQYLDLHSDFIPEIIDGNQGR